MSIIVSVDCEHTEYILHGVPEKQRAACLCIEGTSVVPPRRPPGTGSQEHAAGIPETSPAIRELPTVNIFVDEWF